MKDEHSKARAPLLPRVRLPKFLSLIPPPLPPDSSTQTSPFCLVAGKGLPLLVLGELGAGKHLPQPAAGSDTNHRRVLPECTEQLGVLRFRV